MDLDVGLPGLEHLLSTCREGGFIYESFPPAQHPLLPGALICDRPVDPVLAAFYRRLGGLYITDFINILRFDDQVDGLTKATRLMGSDPDEPFRPFLFFGKEPALSYYYGTLPALASEAGCQPVFYLDAYLEPSAVPVASDVNRFFDLYARYLKLVDQEGIYKLERVSEISFPWAVPHLVAQDKPLVELIRQGRVDPWLVKDDPRDEVATWLKRVLEAHAG